MVEILLYAILILGGFFAFAALLLWVCELASRFLKVKDLALYLLGAVGLLISGFFWKQYADGQITLWQAVVPTLFAGGLPLWAALYFLIPDLLAGAFAFVVKWIRRPGDRT